MLPQPAYAIIAGWKGFEMPISLTRLLGGDPTKKEIEKLIPLVEEINELEASFEALSDDELRQKTTVEFKQRLGRRGKPG